MKTSCFKNYTGDMGVSICLYPPAAWSGMQFPALAPNKSIFYEKKSGKIDEKEYERRYRKEVLSKLDPQKVYNMFKNNVLLCWENSGEFCHRRIVSSWLFETIGVIVDEWTSDDEKILTKNLNPLF